MSNKPGLWARWKSYRPSKRACFSLCLASIAATVVIGFNWGGWVTAIGATERTEQAVADARAQQMAGICISSFADPQDAAGELARLEKAEPWEQSDFIRNGGWVNLPGTTQPVVGAARICAQHLLTQGLPENKDSSSSGTKG